jgi:beta-glucosidase/6-phospho-beta-glucosidase/beta-galactosidase
VAVPAVSGVHLPEETEEMDAWLNFVGAAIERYKDRIIYWEIWNEPNHRKFWGAPPSAEDYGRLVKLTAEKIRSIHP